MEERLQELPRRFFWLYMYYYVRYRRWQTCRNERNLITGQIII